MTTARVHAVVTGGGTSGHVVPALAILEALVDAGHDPDTLRYVGARRGVETRLVPPSGIEGHFLPIAGLQRSIAPRRLLANLILPIRVWRSRRQARVLLRQWRPKVVVSVGGYASDPAAHAAQVEGVPLVCVSYDRRPGLATRRQAQVAVATATAFAGSDLPRAHHTGAPVRRSIRMLDRGSRRAVVRSERGIEPESLVLAVVGGSLGSATLNSFVSRVMVAMGERPRPRGGWTVLHVCGPRFVDEFAPVPPPGVVVKRYGYEEHMEDLYSACDLLVARAGASTVAEVATAGVPAVLVPWPGAVKGHQELNARALSDSGAAVLMTDEQLLSPEGSGAVLDVLLDPHRLASLSRRAREEGEMHRGDALIRLIDDAAS